MKWLYFLNFFIFYNIYAQDGTQSRLEIEVKNAYEFSPFSVKTLNNEFNLMIKKIKKDFKLSKLLDNKYFISENFKGLVFEDFYFDDENYTLAKQSLSYRLRYRYLSRDRYIRHKLFKRIKDFYPNRCEIQFKKDYKNVNNISNAKETRFEFRNASSPFNIKKDAPPPPWPVKDYLNYTKNGFYKDYKILPYLELLNSINFNKDTFSNKFKLITNRYRNHLNIRNPWGNGPNPTQAFIISLDHVQVFHHNKFKYQFLELEVEIDRSILEKMIEGSKIKEAPDVNQFSKKAIDLAQHDLKILVTNIEFILNNKFKFNKLEFDSKYHRAWKQI